ncbi:Putative regulator or DNA-binding protein [Mycobacteroides abscessus subsp. massiliense]|uniref:helix-turn-helix domain-containing protein n=1 Tax=Mycobacteroides abscessus TaxID=36809 RepID=UPI00037AE537|nr:helix-turn-helix transcriptional regulator [Mycobacteroides abscessus]ANN97512.1 hypothetical protein BAB74_01105 [Mycobacteroides abscessus]SLE89004.1 Putative regulator or DNA-binding protein [Mycobacteroides abscessus subsp. massiliense]SLH29676.1 Putative regulator or DNA-binding protein [Mycobacteroides abscessus subsp. massiliense]
MPHVDEQAKAWQLALAKRIGKAVYDLRRKYDLTAQALAQRTAELGYPISRVAISKIESNSRSGKVDVAEIVVLAAALHTSPVALIYPGPYDEKVESLPGANDRQFDAVQWFSAESTEKTSRASHPSRARTPEHSAVAIWYENTEKIRLWRHLDSVMAMRTAVLTSEDEPDRQQIAFYDRQIDALRTQLGINRA